MDFALTARSTLQLPNPQEKRKNHRGDVHLRENQDIKINRRLLAEFNEATDQSPRNPRNADRKPKVQSIAQMAVTPNTTEPIDQQQRSENQENEEKQMELPKEQMKETPKGMDHKLRESKDSRPRRSPKGIKFKGGNLSKVDETSELDESQLDESPFTMSKPPMETEDDDLITDSDSEYKPNRKFGEYRSPIMTRKKSAAIQNVESEYEESFGDEDFEESLSKTEPPNGNPTNESESENQDNAPQEMESRSDSQNQEEETINQEETSKKPKGSSSMTEFSDIDEDDL